MARINSNASEHSRDVEFHIPNARAGALATKPAHRGVLRTVPCAVFVPGRPQKMNTNVELKMNTNIELKMNTNVERRTSNVEQKMNVEHRTSNRR